ncbi:transmembrane protein 135 isoform X2 [Hydra vulgaris]|uniref:Transmembrane protein 135 isoform X2 n=1 Tax=Hydra vulgaris TaxID=6087 RepID=A0ABM4BGJ2_HYDVU
MAGTLSKSISCTCYEVGHTWDKSCVNSTIELFYDCFKYSLKLYTPLYAASAVLSGKRLEYFKKKFIRDVLQSSLFLGSSGGFMIFCFCVCRKLFGCFNILSVGFLPGIISAYCAILIERKSRRGALAVYMLNQAMETCFNMLKSSGYARDLPFGEVFLFAGSLSITMYLFRSNNLPDGIIKDILQKVLSEKKLNKSVKNNDVTYIKTSCELAGKAFLAGYSLQASFNLLTTISRLYKHPSQLIKTLISKANFCSGAFLGSLVAIFKLTEKALSKFQSLSAPAKSAIAGAISGFAMLFQRSSYIAIYLTSKTMESLYMSGIKKGMFPYFKHFDSLLYALTTGLMFHAALIQPLYLRPTYFKFLIRLTNTKFAGVNRFKMDPFGLDSSKIDRMVAAGAFKFGI